MKPSWQARIFDLYYIFAEGESGNEKLGKLWLEKRDISPRNFLRKFIAQTLFIIGYSESKLVKPTFVPRQAGGSCSLGRKTTSAALRHSDVGNQDITLNFANVMLKRSQARSGNGLDLIYVIAPCMQDAVTLRTRRPLKRSAVLVRNGDICLGSILPLGAALRRAV